METRLVSFHVFISREDIKMVCIALKHIH